MRSGTCVLGAIADVRTADRHALIIEDEIVIALEIEDLLRDLGFASFDIAESPAEALACAHRRKPDLITADYRIVGGTGLEAADAITAFMGPIPVVFVTGNVDVVQGLGKPVVEKPIQARALERAWIAAEGRG
jgi:CheY-like chemotaxis protein